MLQHSLMGSETVVITLPILKEMLDLQRSSFQVLIDDVKNEVKGLKKDLEEVKTSISFISNVTDSLKESIKVTGNKVGKLQKSLGMLEVDTHEGLDMLADQQEYLENQSRRNNVKITGVPESDNEKCWDETEKLVKSVIKTELGIEDDFEIVRAHRVGKRINADGDQPHASNRQTNRTSRPLNILAKFLSWKAKEKVIKKPGN